MFSIMYFCPPSLFLQAAEQEATLDDLYEEMMRMMDTTHRLALKLIDRVSVVLCFLPSSVCLAQPPALKSIAKI